MWVCLRIYSASPTLMVYKFIIFPLKNRNFESIPHVLTNPCPTFSFTYDVFLQRDASLPAPNRWCWTQGPKKNKARGSSSELNPCLANPCEIVARLANRNSYLQKMEIEHNSVAQFYSNSSQRQRTHTHTPLDQKDRQDFWHCHKSQTQPPNKNMFTYCMLLINLYSLLKNIVHRICVESV